MSGIEEIEEIEGRFFVENPDFEATLQNREKGRKKMKVIVYGNGECCPREFKNVSRVQVLRPEETGMAIWLNSDLKSRVLLINPQHIDEVVVEPDD